MGQIDMHQEQKVKAYFFLKETHTRNAFLYYYLALLAPQSQTVFRVMLIEICNRNMYVLKKSTLVLITQQKNSDYWLQNGLNILKYFGVLTFLC